MFTHARERHAARCMVRPLTLAAALTLAGVLAPTSLAYSNRAGDPEPHVHGEIVPPANFAACVQQLRDQVAALEAGMKGKSAADLHEHASALEQLAPMVGKLALAAGSGVPREKVKIANLTAKELSKAGAELHEAIDKNNIPAAREALTRVTVLVEQIAAVTPGRFVCDMKCEPGKVYDAAGKCPVCKMELTPYDRAPFGVTLTPSATIVPGKPVDLSITLADPAGSPVKDLEVVHEHPLHFIVVSADLAFYAHEHPEQRPDGTFVLKGLTLPTGGGFTAFADFTPKGGKNAVATTRFTVAGEPKQADAPLVDNTGAVITIDEYEFRLRCNGGPFVQNADSFIRLGVDKNNQSVTELEPLMGERGHLVIISADGQAYIHAHPISEPAKDGSKSAEPAGRSHAGHGHAGHGHDGHDHDGLWDRIKDLHAANGRPSDVIFHARFPAPGMYRAFSQVKIKGKVYTVASTIEVQPESAAAPGGAQPVKGHEGHDHDAGKKALPASGGAR